MLQRFRVTTTLSRLTATFVALLLALVLGPAPTAHAGDDGPPYRVVWNASPILAGGLAKMLVPGWKPRGSNDPSCELTDAHPHPVVLVNFTTGAGWEWSAGSPFLRNNGYCVFSFTYGNTTPFDNSPVQALGDIRESAKELRDNVDRILAETGAHEVDLVGWSQGGGMLPHYYINFLGGARKVHKFVGIAPGNHGATGSGLLTPQTLEPVFGPLLLWLMPAFGQQIAGSALAEEIYADGDTRPGVDYTTIITLHDEVATPVENQVLDGPNATNIVLQDGCAKDRSEHLSIGFSKRTWRHVLNALHPAQVAPVPCVAVWPYFGMPPFLS